MYVLKPSLLAFAPHLNILFEARDGDDRSKGYARVDFESKRDAVKVIKEHQE